MKVKVTINNNDLPASKTIHEFDELFLALSYIDTIYPFAGCEDSIINIEFIKTI